MATYGSNPAQIGDVLLYQSLDDGDITITGGVVEMTSNFDTMIYLTLHGSNVEDPGGDNRAKQWWGNWTEPDTARHYRSEYANLVQNIGASSGNLLLIEGAATRDIERAFIDTNIASSIDVSASIPKRGYLQLSIEIEARGTKSQFKYVENWESTA